MVFTRIKIAASDELRCPKDVNSSLLVLEIVPSEPGCAKGQIIPSWSQIAHKVTQADEDMISKLIDDVLLLIMEKVNLTTTMRASVLSTRWRHLPWLLTQHCIDINDFLHEPWADPTVDDHIDKAMESLIQALRSMLAPTRRKSIIKRLCISFFITNGYSSEIGHLLNEAIENGLVKDVELTSGVERFPGHVSDEEMSRHADLVNSFFGNYPNISCCLTRLSLYNATFVGSDLHHLLNTCTQLHDLFLYQCDTGYGSLFKIDAPNSKLNVLEFAHCSFDLVELFCLPKLKELICGFWSSRYLPLTLGYVPCLKEVEIYSAITYQQPFKLSEFLCHAPCTESLILDFEGEKIWLQPEKNQLRSAFSNLRHLSLYGIFVGFGLLWTTALLEAAQALEILDIKVHEHLCEDKEERKQIFTERTNGSWEVSERSHLQLKKLQLSGFNSTEQHIAFVGAIMGQAPNLHAVVLNEQHCKDCSAISENPTRFPKNEDEREAVLNKLRSRFSSRAQIVFREHKHCSDY
ncbi:hypothetical protein ACP70R_005236 [Stipagrostis hirtigluma subsp. patula]